MPSMNPEMLKQLLDEFTEQHELSNQEIAACEQQIFELEALIVKSRERLELVTHDRERVLQMLERYSGDQFVLSQRLEPRPEQPATAPAKPAKPPAAKPAPPAEKSADKTAVAKSLGSPSLRGREPAASTPAAKEPAKPSAPPGREPQPPAKPAAALTPKIGAPPSPGPKAPPAPPKPEIKPPPPKPEVKPPPAPPPPPPKPAAPPVPPPAPPPLPPPGPPQPIRPTEQRPMAAPPFASLPPVPAPLPPQPPPPQPQPAATQEKPKIDLGQPEKPAEEEDDTVKSINDALRGLFR